MKDWNVAGALVSPKGITRHSYNPHRVRNAVACMESGFMRMRLKAPRRSRRVKRRAWRSRSNVSIMRGRGVVFFIVTASGRGSPYTVEGSPSAFPANRTGAPQGEEDLRMKPLASCSSNHDRSAFSFGSERLYMLAEAGRAEGDRRMV